jgi:hypothetical protein
MPSDAIRASWIEKSTNIEEVARRAMLAVRWVCELFNRFRLISRWGSRRLDFDSVAFVELHFSAFLKK